MLIQPVGEVEHYPLDDDPKIILRVVFSNFLHGKLLRGNLESFGALTRLLGPTSGGGRSGGGRRGRLLLLGGGDGGDTGAGSAPVDRDLAGLRGVDMEGDLAQPLGGARRSTAKHLLEEVVARRVTGDTAVDYTAKEGRTTKTVGAVDTTGNLTAGEEAVEGLALLVEDLGLVVDLNATHGEVENGLHERDVEGVVDVEGGVVEEALVPGVLLLAIGNGVVGGEGLLEVFGAAANLLGELLAGHLLHEATARVVAGVEIKDSGGLGVEDEADGELVLVLLLPHHARDVVTVTELVAESVAVGVEEETSLATKGLSSQELGLGVGVLGVNKTSGMDLDLVHVDAVAANGHDHLLAITGGVATVGGGETDGVRPVLLKERVLSKVGGITTGGEDDGSIDALALAVVLIGHAGDRVARLVQGCDAGLQYNLDAIGLGLGQLLEALHESISNSHTGELGIVTTVGTGLGVTTAEGLLLARYCYTAQRSFI